VRDRGQVRLNLFFDLADNRVPLGEFDWVGKLHLSIIRERVEPSLGDSHAVIDAGRIQAKGGAVGGGYDIWLY
jgi:hypothetical protein